MKRINMGFAYRRCSLLNCNGELRYLKECPIDDLQAGNDYYVCRKCDTIHVWNGKDKINTGEKI